MRISWQPVPLPQIFRATNATKKTKKVHREQLSRQRQKSRTRSQIRPLFVNGFALAMKILMFWIAIGLLRLEMMSHQLPQFRMQAARSMGKKTHLKLQRIGQLKKLKPRPVMTALPIIPKIRMILQAPRKLPSPTGES